MPSFDDAVSGAFGRRSADESSLPQVKSSLPPVQAVVEPPHDFHGPERPPPDPNMPTIVAPRREDRPRPRGRPLGSKKRHRDEGMVMGDGGPKEGGGVPKKKRTDPFSSPEERQEVIDSLMRYQAAFPEVAAMVPPDIGTDSYSLDHLQFMLASVTQRINQKQELKILQTGLISTSMMVEFGSTLVPGSPVKLKGFGASISTQIGIFDDVLKQIACKYGGNLPVTVEMQLGMLLLRVAGSTHMVNAAQEKKEEGQKGVVEVKVEEGEHPQPSPSSVPLEL